MDIQEAEVVKKTFNPDANYQWQPSDVFKLSGAELNVLHNTLHLVFNDGRIGEPQKWVMINKLYEITSNIIKKGVEDDIIQEVVEKKASPMKAV